MHRDFLTHAHCSTLQHIAAHCSTLQHIAPSLPCSSTVHSLMAHFLIPLPLPRPDPCPGRHRSPQVVRSQRPRCQPRGPPQLNVPMPGGHRTVRIHYQEFQVPSNAYQYPRQCENDRSCMGPDRLHQGFVQGKQLQHIPVNKV